MVSNKDLMKQARESLSGRWGLAVGTFFVYILIAGGIGVIPIAGGIISLLIGGALALGITIGIIGGELEYTEHRNVLRKRYGREKVTEESNRVIVFPKRKEKG